MHHIPTVQHPEPYQTSYMNVACQNVVKIVQHILYYGMLKTFLFIGVKSLCIVYLEEYP